MLEFIWNFVKKIWRGKSINTHDLKIKNDGRNNTVNSANGDNNIIISGNDNKVNRDIKNGKDKK